MQKLLIYNKGYSDTGKSRALKAVFFRLIAEHGELIQVKRLLHGSLDFCNTRDLGAIFTYRGILVGLESALEIMNLTTDEKIQNNYPICKSMVKEDGNNRLPFQRDRCNHYI